MTINIVQIEEKYIDGFHQAVDTVARERKYITFTEAPPIDSTRSFVRGNIQNDDTQLVALAHDRVIGWCDILPGKRASLAHAAALGMGIIPEYRGQGIGTQLIDAAIKRAQGKGIIRIELLVLEHNKNAQHLYQKMGFVTEGIKRKGLHLDGVYHDEIIMALVT